MGKSALLEATARRAGPGTRVLWAVGRESESELAWAALGELLGPLLDEGAGDRLAEVERTALLGAVARLGVDGPLEPYAVLRGALDVVRVAAAEGPLLAVVDDVQWLDLPSRLAVDHLARHAAGAGIAMAVAGRPDDEHGAPVPATPLAPLDPVAASALLEDLDVRSSSARAWLVDELGGNALLLRAAADALTPAQRRGVASLPEVPPVPPTARRLAADRLAGRSPDERVAMLVVALAGRIDAGAAADAVVRAGGAPGALAALEEAGLVSVADGAVRLTHPTLRTAAVDGATGAARRVAHAALAEVLADPARRALHRGLSLVDPDDAVARQLEAQALDLAQRAAPLSAARHLELAARLSTDDRAGSRRLRLAAEAAAEAGEDDTALALLERAELLGADPDERWRRRRVRLRVALRAGEVDGPVRELRALAQEVAPSEPGAAAALLLDGVPALVRTVRLGDLGEVAAECLDLARRVGDDRLVRRAEIALGVAETAVGAADGPAHLDRYHELLPDEGPQAGGFLAEVVAPSLAVFRPREADALYVELDTVLRDAASAPALVALLAARAIATQTRRFPEAVAHAREAVELAETIGRPVLGRLPAVSLVLAAGLTGDRDACESAAALLLASGEPLLVQAALIGVGALHLSVGELEEALVTYERIGAEFGLGAGVTRWEPEWCEVLVRLGRLEEAVHALEQAEATETAWLAEGPFARVRGMLADDVDASDRSFTSAVSWFQAVGNRMGEARTELCWGERARRGRRRAAARQHLTRAVELFEVLGAGVWVERSAHELAAVQAGVATAVSGIGALTARELEVARRAAAGRTNREIAAALFVSPRTVETQLASALRKLGLANRRELAARAADEPGLRHGG